MDDKFASTQSWTARSQFILAKCAGHRVRWRKRLLMLGASAAVAIAVIACGIDAADDPEPVVTSTVTAETPLPSSTVLPSAETGEQLSGQESTARANYLQNASRVIDLVGRTAQLLGGIGLHTSLSGNDLINTKNLAGAAIGSFDLAKQNLDAEPVPEGMEELHSAILTSLRFYGEAAQKLLDIPETGEFDFFEFQRPFQTGGENFHEAGRLLVDS